MSWFKRSLAASAPVGYPNVSNLVQQTLETSTPLLANVTFNGATQDNGSNGSAPGSGYSKFRAMAYADQAGTIAIQQSRDGITWRTTVGPTAVVAGAGTVIESLITRRYTRVQYVNGGTNQGVFELDTEQVAI